MRWRSFFFVAALVAVDLAPTPCFAGPAETRAAADALFREGRALVKQGNLAAGCDKLEASQNLDPAPGTLLALADCFEKDGRLASAWSTWNDAVVLARQRNDKRRMETAEKRAQTLEGKLPKLQVDVPRDSAVEGLVVKRNGKIIESSIFGSAIPVDPGPQAIFATAPGRQPWDTSVDIKAEPGVTTVSIPVLVKVPEAPKVVVVPVEKPEPEPPKPPPPKSNIQRTIGIVLTSVGIVGIAGGGAFGGLTLWHVQRAEGQCTGTNPPKCSQQGLDAYGSADRTATVSDISFGIGGTMLVTGLVVWATAPSRTPETKTSLFWSPWVGPGTVGTSLAGEF